MEIWSQDIAIITAKNGKMFVYGQLPQWVTLRSYAYFWLRVIIAPTIWPEFRQGTLRNKRNWINSEVYVRKYTVKFPSLEPAVVLIIYTYIYVLIVVIS